MNKLYLNLRNSLFRYLLPVGCLLFWGAAGRGAIRVQRPDYDPCR